MALTDVEELYNVALDYVGDHPITDDSVSRESKQYLKCARHYPKARDETISAHLWNEATEQVMVLEDTTAPLFGFEKRFAVPSDYLRILRPGSSLYDWEVQDGYIVTDHNDGPATWVTDKDYVAGQYVTVSSVTYLCDTSHTSDVWDTDLVSYWTTQTDDLSTINLTYIKQITDVTKFSPLLYDAIAMLLASKVVVSLTGDISKKQELVNMYENLGIRKARSNDAMQGKPTSKFNSSWLRSRTGY